jgi:hypothetical protein
VQALAARGLHEALEAELLEPRADAARRVHHPLPGNGGIGVEVEHQAVRLLQPLGHGVPGVDLEDTELDEADEARKVVDHEVLADLLGFLDLDPT